MVNLKQQIRNYWNKQVHDEKLTKNPVGTKDFFDDIYKYHFGKQNYLPKVIDYKSFANKKILGMGCGIGVDLLRFAKNKAIVTGVDFAENQIKLAKKNFASHKLKGTFLVMDAENLKFKDNTFDVVFAHGILQYTPNPKKMVSEIYRILKPGGKALVAVYHTHSWLNFVSKLTGTPLEHQHAPVFRTFSFNEVKELFNKFSSTKFFGERFPVKTKLHRGMRANIYNEVFIPLFNLIPRKLISRIGWHIVGEAIK